MSIIIFICSTVEKILCYCNKFCKNSMEYGVFEYSALERYTLCNLQLIAYVVYIIGDRGYLQGRRGIISYRIKRVIDGRRVSHSLIPHVLQ